MYKVMLADDEGIVIDALTFIIQKNFGDTCTIESAKSGRSVIELAEWFRPDIAFMDIQMPGINGIDAIREIRQSCPNTVFIVLSAYDRFDYAKEALGLGVMDYLNKPIEKDLIVEVLKKAMKQVNAARERRSNDLMIKEKMEIVVPIIESGLIYSVLFQENYAQDTEKYKHLLGISEDYGYMMILQCGDEQENGYMTNAVGVSVRTHPFYSEIRETIKEYFHAVVGTMMANMIIIYVPVAESIWEDEYERRIEIIENARKMIRKLHSKVDAKFRIGIGSVRPLSQASVSYTEAQNSFRVSTGSVAHVKDLPIGCDYEEDYPIETEERLFAAVEAGNVQETAVQANRFFDWMIDTYYENTMDIKLKVLEYVLWAEHIGYLSGGAVYQFRSRSDYLKTINEMDNYEDLRSWFLTKLKTVCANVANKKAASSANTIAKAMEYIKGHYQKELSLDEVSKEVNISPYYFSKLFKEEAGVNFIEYVTSMRIERAKELLQQTDKSMKEICAEIGYADPNYFSRTFKKNVGLTPTEFKEKHN